MKIEISNFIYFDLFPDSKRAEEMGFDYSAVWQIFKIANLRLTVIIYTRYRFSSISSFVY